MGRPNVGRPNLGRPNLGRPPEIGVQQHSTQPRQATCHPMLECTSCAFVGEMHMVLDLSKSYPICSAIPTT